MNIPPYSPFPTMYPPNPYLGMGTNPYLGMNMPKKPGNGLVIGFLIGTIVLILIIFIVDIVMYTTQKGLFAPYKPPIPPADSVSPNGNPTVQALTPIPANIKTTSTNNLNQWGQGGPQADPVQFGPKITA
jgi:hypothetical protein